MNTITTIINLLPSWVVDLVVISGMDWAFLAGLVVLIIIVHRMPERPTRSAEPDTPEARRQARWDKHFGGMDPLDWMRKEAVRQNNAYMAWGHANSRLQARMLADPRRRVPITAYLFWGTVLAALAYNLLVK